MPCPRLAVLIAGLALILAAPAPAQTPSELAVPSPLKPGDAFGEPVILPERAIVYLAGHSDWESAFDTLVKSYKTLSLSLDKQGIKPNGPPMTIYTETNDIGFGFRAALPVAQAPKQPLEGGVAVGQAPSGKALKFVHRGSYVSMDQTYEAITDYLDDKQLDAKNQFIEEYVSDILTAPPDDLTVNIYVPVK
jgi:effector-binding domain-containing protein